MKIAFASLLVGVAADDHATVRQDVGTVWTYEDLGLQCDHTAADDGIAAQSGTTGAAFTCSCLNTKHSFIGLSSTGAFGATNTYTMMLPALQHLKGDGTNPAGEAAAGSAWTTCATACGADMFGMFIGDAMQCWMDFPAYDAATSKCADSTFAAVSDLQIPDGTFGEMGEYDGSTQGPDEWAALSAEHVNNRMNSVAEQGKRNANFYGVLETDINCVPCIESKTDVYSAAMMAADPNLVDNRADVVADPTKTLVNRGAFLPCAVLQCTESPETNQAIMLPAFADCVAAVPALVEAKAAMTKTAEDKAAAADAEKPTEDATDGNNAAGVATVTAVASALFAAAFAW